MLTTLDVLRQRAELTPDRPLLITRDQTFSYADFLRRSLQIANYLEKKHLAGDAIGIASKHPYYYWTAVLGCWFSGRISVFLNPSLPDEELSEQVRFTRCREVLGDNLDLPLFSLEKNFAPVGSNECAAILMTSGSTGQSKGVCLSLHQLSWNAQAVVERLGLDEEDRLLVNAPPHFTSPFCHFLGQLFVGGSVVWDNGFYMGARFLELLNHFQCSGVGGTPSHATRILGEATADKVPPSLRFWICSGDALPFESARRLGQLLPQIQFFQVYGLTEVAGRLCIQTIGQSTQLLGSVGTPLTGMEIQILKEDKTIAGPNESGEVMVCGPSLMLGYWDGRGNPAPMESHWFATGDIGFVDSQGNLWLEGRKDDVFKSGGEKVSLIKIRNHLLQQAGVREAAVVATDDPWLGKIPVAFIVGTGIDKEALRAELLRQLPASHIPREIFSVDLLPHLDSGKIDRKKLLSLSV